MRRLLAVGLLAALTLGCKQDPSGSGHSGAAKTGLSRDEFIQVETESLCTLLREDGDLSDVDEYREPILKKLGKTQHEYFLAVKAYAADTSAKDAIAAQTDACRKETGWTLEAGPEGQKSWERSDE